METSKQDETPNALIQLVQSLSHAITYTDSSNIDTNRKLWDNYARDWSKDAEWVVKMVKNLPDVNPETKPSEYLEYLGEEWSDKKSFNQVLEEYFFPYISESSVVGEIGSGGGRVASRIAPRCQKMYCFDISKEMLKQAQKSVEASIAAYQQANPNQDFSTQQKPEFELLQNAALPFAATNSFDFIYAFDVFPHVDLHTQWQYYQEIARVLKSGGKAIIHTANMEAPLGWQRFAQQDKYTVGGFYFMNPSMVLTMAQKAGLKAIRFSSPENSQNPNLYYNRDFVLLVEKP